MYLRWVLTDGVTSWTMPINPKSQGGLYAPRTINAKRTTNGTAVLSEAERQVPRMKFDGVTLNKAHYDQLVAWSNSAVVLTITDHYGRQIKGVFTQFDVTSPTRTSAQSGRAWLHNYSAEFIVTSVGAATRGDNWEAI
jgi:hypothetical protein